MIQTPTPMADSSEPPHSRVIDKNLHKKLEEKLQQTYGEEDSLLFFLELVESKSSRIYFMINIVLMIWLSQIILYSNLKDIPRSIYLVSPLFSKDPMQSIQITTDGVCPKGFEKERLGTLPDIQEHNLFHTNITSWKSKGVEFCVQRIQGKVMTGRCPSGTVKCNNLCVRQGNQCPITNIRKINSVQDKKYFETVWYKNEYPTFYYVHSRNEGKPIIALWITIDSTCANKYFLDDKFQRVIDFKAKIKEPCFQEGDLNNMWQKFDSIPLDQVLRANNYQSKDRLPLHLPFNASLGFFTSLNIDTQNPYCKQIIKSAQNLPSILPKPRFPAIANILLITSLIYMMVSILWWVGNGCGCKRGLVECSILVSAVELVNFLIIKNKFSPYLSIKWANEIQNCVPDIEALKHWHFGISNNEIFLVIVFCNTVYLMLFFVSFVLLRTLYRPS